MKILLITGIYPPDIGGPATYSKLLFDELPKRGIEVSVLSFGEVRKYPKIIRHIVFFFKILFRSKGVDLLYAQDPVSVGLPTMLVSKIIRKKYIMRVAGDYAWEQGCQRFGIKDDIDSFQNKTYSFSVNFLKKIQSLVVKNSFFTITPSHYFRELVSGWIKIKDKVFTIYNGILLKDIRETKNEAREKLRLPRDQKIILSAGRLVPWKGFDLLIEIVSELNKESDWSLIIVGDGPERGKLEEKIEKEKIKDKVFLVGSVDREKMFLYYRASDFFVLNTSFESFSFQVVEAMNSGVPVITTNVGNLSEIVENNKEGLLVQYNNKEQILKAIRLINSNEGLKENFVKNALKKAKNFSIERTINNLIDFLKKI